MTQNYGSIFDENGCLFSQISLFETGRNFSINLYRSQKKPKINMGTWRLKYRNYATPLEAHLAYEVG